MWGRLSWRLKSAAVVALACVSAGAAHSPASTAAGRGASRRRILYALDRLTWGPRPGEAAAVEKIGLRRWIDLQLHPARIPENPQLQLRLDLYATLRMSSRRLAHMFPPPGVVKAIAQGRLPMPESPVSRAIVRREIEQYQRRLKRKNTPQEQAQRRRRRMQQLRNLLGPSTFQQLLRAPWPRRLAAWESLDASARSQAIALLPRGALMQLAVWLPADQQRAVEIERAPQIVPLTDLQQARMLRAIYSRRQLADVLADFWYNHFNVYFFKGADRYLATAFEENVIRPHVLGKFSDLLLATAQSPAMLFYLDNWRSVAPASARPRASRAMFGRPMRPGFRPFGFPAAFFPSPRAAMRAASAGRARRHPRAIPRGGVNENYGRELLELHTLGVDTGYTQKDVDQAALCLTGWTIYRPQFSPRFWFNARVHAAGKKVVLGHVINAGGVQDGLELLQLLANSPVTARHISTELAQRFVSDHPPAALVNRMVAAWESSGGDLRQVMRAMIDAPEFWQPAFRRDKVKAPFQMVVSAVRALDARVTNPERLVQITAAMGEPLFLDFPPNGYSNQNPDWVSSAGLVDRMNFALALAHNQVPGAQVKLARFAGSAQAAGAGDSMLRLVLGGQVSASTRAALDQALARQASSSGRFSASPAAARQLAAALLVGSPDFQRY